MTWPLRENGPLTVSEIGLPSSCLMPSSVRSSDSETFPDATPPLAEKVCETSRAGEILTLAEAFAWPPPPQAARPIAAAIARGTAARRRRCQADARPTRLMNTQASTRPAARLALAAVLAALVGCAARRAPSRPIRSPPAGLSAQPELILENGRVHAATTLAAAASAPRLARRSPTPPTGAAARAGLTFPQALASLAVARRARRVARRRRPLRLDRRARLLQAA